MFQGEGGGRSPQILIKSNKIIFNILKGSKNVTSIFSERMDPGFNLPSFNNTMEEASGEVPLIKPLQSSTLNPKIEF